MDRVKQNDTRLLQAQAERQAMEEQLQKCRSEHSKQLEMLRFELDEHVRQAVMAEEKQSQLEKKVQNLHEERKSLQAELASRSKREASLERALVSERNELRGARSRITQLHEQLERDNEQRRSVADELTRLKIDNAKLHERMKIASMELTMQESKVSEAEKKLQFTSEDVSKKLHEQRCKLEKLGMEKLDEIRRKHQAEIVRLKKDHQLDKQNTLITYVSAEDYAKLDTQTKEYSRKLEEAELQLGDREEKLRSANEQIADMAASHERELAKERKRRERLSKKLVEQDKNHEDIRQELDNYRKLIEGLDVTDNQLFNTPFGAKRTRVSFDAKPPAENGHSKKPSGSGTPSIEARRVLARRVLTPVRKNPTSLSTTHVKVNRTVIVIIFYYAE